jgi:zinc transport system ATP-binding protein
MPATPGHVLEVEHLSVQFDDVEVLRDLSFVVPTGALLALIGPNGSGKTVLLRALIGAITHTGVVRWAAHARIGYVPQKIDLERNLPVTARDLLEARARLTGASDRAVTDAVARTGLAAATLQSALGALSGGQLQRVLMAFALLGDPTILLLDEPTAGVDEPGQERMKDTLQRLHDGGVTIIMISHELNVVLRSATTVLCLTHDHACFGVAREALTPDLLTRVYGEPIGLFVHDAPVR